MYVRPTKEKRKEPHALQTEFGIYKQLSMELDSGWNESFLQDLHDEARLFLSQISSVIDHIKSQDYSDYRKEVADKKKGDLIKKSREILLSSLKKHIDSARDNIAAIQGKILRVTEPESLKDTNKLIERLFIEREIRDELRLIPPQDRGKLIEGNLPFIQACLSSPTDILSKEHLERLRIEFAYSVDPSLEIELKDARIQYKKTRERAGEINASAIMMLTTEKIPDPISPQEFFSVFVPDTELEKAKADKMIQNFVRDQEKKQRTKEFEDSHPGINMQPEDRLHQIRK